MASSSRHRATLAILLLALASPGCWTGRIVEAGRLRESVVGYRSAALRGDSLWLGYTVRLAGRGDARGRLEPRAVSVGLAALRADPEYPVDAFPLERRPDDSSAPDGSPLPLLEEGQPPSAAAAASSLVLRVESDADGHAVLRLCPSGEGACIGQLYAAALYRDRTAWWVYPLAPLGAVLDVALLPLQLVSTAPFFLAGD